MLSRQLFHNPQFFALVFTGGLALLPAAAFSQAVTAPLKAMPNAGGAPNRTLSLYDEKLNRMAEILGSLHYLYNLCGSQTDIWRDYMQKFIPALRADARRQQRLYAAFNRSYEAFAGNYAACTKAAKEAAERYRLEGQNLSRNLVDHFGSDAYVP